MENYDIIVIGGGPAGLMAAIQAAKQGKSVAVLEKSKAVGRKILLSGGGRCNYTNISIKPDTISSSYGKKGQFLQSAMAQFDPFAVIQYFEEKGIKHEVEGLGKVFPMTDRAEAILDALLSDLNKYRVSILTETEFLNFKFKGQRIQSLTAIHKGQSKELFAKAYIVAVGGRSYLAEGKMPAFYDYLQTLGIKINTLRPSLSPLKIKDKAIRDLQGVSLRGVYAWISAPRKIFSETGDLVFTHFGLSGPLALDASKAMADNNLESAFLEIDLEPRFDEQALAAKLLEIFENNQNRQLEVALKVLLPQGVADYVLKAGGFDPHHSCNGITKEQRMAIAKLLKHCKLEIEKVMGFDMAMTTSGGVELNQIDQKTMRCKNFENLFFCGEILDIDGRTGGYNMQASWATGYASGLGAAAVVDK